eukprot:TRINITY_DN13040_c0_g1_i6.p1 TRINITY_DN13040_c0_g1~~TRINITY_DN13040_c0_g1_i6.p1  ORF type:complete len:151 (-),score=13.01 TRINITY_DN13040_c0_g1_i6:150-602(-)
MTPNIACAIPSVLQPVQSNSECLFFGKPFTQPRYENPFLSSPNLSELTPYTPGFPCSSMGQNDFAAFQGTFHSPVDCQLSPSLMWNPSQSSMLHLTSPGPKFAEGHLEAADFSSTSSDQAILMEDEESLAPAEPKRKPNISALNFSSIKN